MGKLIFLFTIFFLFTFNLNAQVYHSIDFDSTSIFFNGQTKYSKNIKKTVIQVISDVEKLIIPKYNNKIKILVTTIDKKIPALAYIVPKYENILLLRNGITTGRVWQKYNTSNINPNDLTYDCELFINTNYEFNNISTEFDSSKFDLYSIILHEYTHSLGFFSMITKNGESIETNYKQGIFSLFDTRLRTDSNRLISFDINNLVSFNSDYIPRLKDECAISYLNELPIVFSPSDWQNGSSISHLDTNCLDKKFVMMPSIYKGQIKRIPLFEDLYVLSTLGYNISGLFQGDSIISKKEISSLSKNKIPIANNDYIDTISVIGNNIIKIPVSLLISNDENIDKIIPIENEFIKFKKKNYSLNDTLEITLERFRNPYQFNYYSISDDGFISNPARVNIVLPIENNSVGDCRRDSRNLLCNGDFEQVTSIGQLKLSSEFVPDYLYNRDDIFEPCVPSKFLAGWNLSYTPDIYTYKNIDDLPFNYDPNFSTNYNSDFPFTYGFLPQIKKLMVDKNNNYFLGLYVGSFSPEDFLNVNNLRIETISQRLIGIKENEKYKLDLDMNPFATASEVARFYVMFTKEELCSENRLNIISNKDYLLLSSRMDYNITRNNERNYGMTWQHLEYKNLDLSGYRFVYFLANKNNYYDLTMYYYFLDNISLRPMSYSLDKQDINYNFCDIGTLEIPIKIKKEIDGSDTLLVKLSNSRLNFDTEGKVINFGKGTKDTTVYFTATYNSDYWLNPEYIVDIELESNKKGNLGKEDITLTINNNNLDVRVFADDYCGEDSIFLYVEITQKSFTSIDEGQVYLYLPKNIGYKNKPVIIENTLDPNAFITTTSQTENLESIYKIYFNNTLAKSTVHGVGEDLKLKIRFAVKMELLDSFNIIKTVTNLFADGCEKTQFDTIYSNQLRNRLVFDDTTLCNNLDLSFLNSRNLKIIDGPDSDDLILTKSGDYIVSYTTVEDCRVQDTFNLNLTNDFYLKSTLSYSDSSKIIIRIDDKFFSKTDTIREFKGSALYKIYPVLKGVSGGKGSTIQNLAPSDSTYQIKDTLFLVRNYDISNIKFDNLNSNYQNIVISYPKSDSINTKSSSRYFNGCEYKTDDKHKVIQISDSSNRIFDYQLKERIINIYPNPTDKILNIEYEVLKEGKFSFQIFDLLGRELYSDTKNFKIGSYKKSIDISRFVNGTYSIMIVTPRNVYYKRFIIFK